MKRAIVFPGQGSQTVGMGKELSASFTEARLVFEEVDDAIGQHLSRVIFEGPEPELTLTENAQPAIMASSMALLRVLEKQTGFNLAAYGAYVAGHSLGEYTALCAAGALSLGETARLLKLRGEAMQKAVPAGKGAMAAILGLTLEQVMETVSDAAALGVCVLANDNSPGQSVISGEVLAVEKACEVAKEKGAKRALMLAVSAPFHSPLMQPAQSVMQDAFAKSVMHVPTLPLIANVTAKAVHDPVAIRSLLVEQVTAQVRWRESVHYMKEQGVTFALEIGVGKVLSGLIKRTEKDIATLCIEGPQDIDAFAKAA